VTSRTARTGRTARTARTSGATRTPTAGVEGAVLDAAARLVLSGGPHALGIRAIASEAGVAPMSIYNRFESKAGIIDALMIRGFERLTSVTARPDPDPLDPLDRLRASGHAYRAFALEDKGTYSLMFERAIPDYLPSAPAMQTAARSFDELTQQVAAAQDAGVIVGGSPTEVAQRLWAAIHGAVSLEQRGVCFAADTDQHFAALLETVLIGLAPDGGVPGGNPVRT
jgi:AcrR family transcriptional regulator